MKNIYLVIAVVLGLATLAYVGFKFASGSPAPAVGPSTGLAAQTDKLNQLVGDVANAADNLHHSLKSSGLPAGVSRAADDQVAELMRIVDELTRANAGQQQTIRQLTLAPQKDSGSLEQVVTIVGIASTLLTMWLSWRKDRREIDELKAKLRELKTPGGTATA